MYMERYLRGIAGILVLASLLLGNLLSEWWLLLGVFVGFNLLQSAFSNWCPMKSVLRLFGVRSCEEELTHIRERNAP
ncbi:MAG: DUF2892 domain-containing protein [Candidatus Latescibacter sp.]|nr:DUF2892 domain-containing protein [Candidatus Latescibacter sp.]